MFNQPRYTHSDTLNDPEDHQSNNYINFANFDKIKYQSFGVFHSIIDSFRILFHFLNYLNPFRWLTSILESIHQFINSPHTHRSILGSIILFLIFILSLVVSVIAYSTFYYTYVPRIGFNLPVWLQYGEGRIPYAIIDFSSHSPEIVVDQTYDVSLLLTVPTNDRNMALGNFMVRVSLISAPPTNMTLHQVSRHASLIYEPAFARILHGLKHLRTLFFFSSPPSLQRLRLPLFERRIIQPRALGKRGKAAYARLDVGRQDAYDSVNPSLLHSGGGELQVYDVALVFDAHLEGLRWLLYYHPCISFLIFTTLFLTVELITVIFTWAVILGRYELKELDGTQIARRFAENHLKSFYPRGEELSKDNQDSVKEEKEVGDESEKNESGDENEKNE